MTPFRASTSTIASSAVDAPVTILRVLDMARRVGNNKLAPRRGEVAVGNIDRDALLTLSAEAVGEKRKVDFAIALQLTRAFDGFVLILENRFRVVQQPAD